MLILLLLLLGTKIFLERKSFKLMKDKAIVCNIGHFDNEIDMSWLNNNYGNTKIEIKPQVDLYEINGKQIIVLAEGRLVKSWMRHWSSKFCYKCSFTNQTLAQLEIWNNSNNYENKVYMLPKHLDEKVAKLHLG